MLLTVYSYVRLQEKFEAIFSTMESK